VRFPSPALYFKKSCYQRSVSTFLSEALRLFYCSKIRRGEMARRDYENRLYHTKKRINCLCT
ncbi:HapC, partial [Listeria seeligeri FSL S4-171]